MEKTDRRAFIIGLIVLLIANTSALVNISASFSDVPYSLITLVNNIPNLCAVIFTLVAGALVNRKVTLKNMILIGTGLHCVGGIMPAFTGSSFALLMLGRFAFGIGYGIMQGLCISMSFKLVTNEKLRAAAMPPARHRDKQWEAQLTLRLLYDGPRLGIGHAHGHGRAPQGMRLAHMAQELRNTGAEAFCFPKDPDADNRP